MLVNLFFTCIAKYLKDNNHNIHYFTRKHATRKLYY